MVAKTQSSESSKSEIVSAKTYDAPNLVKIAERTPRSLKIEWVAPEEDMIQVNVKSLTIKELLNLAN